MGALTTINLDNLTLLAQKHSGNVLKSDHTAERKVRLHFSGLYFEEALGYMADWGERTQNSFVFRTLTASSAI